MRFTNHQWRFSRHFRFPKRQPSALLSERYLSIGVQNCTPKDKERALARKDRHWRRKRRGSPGPAKTRTTNALYLYSPAHRNPLRRANATGTAQRRYAWLAVQD